MVVDLAETVGLVVLEDNHKEEMDLVMGTLGQVGDTSRVEVVHRMAYQGMVDQEGHLGPIQQVVARKMEVDIEDDAHMEDHFVPELGTLEVGLVGDLALGVCDVAAPVLEPEPALVLEVEDAIRSINRQLANDQ